MEAIRLSAEQLLGGQWEYYRRIKKGDEGFKFGQEESLAEQMKATRSALKFTSKATRKAYWASFKSATAEVKGKGGIKAVPTPAENPDGAEVQTLPPELDGYLISWAPLKFLTNVKLIREKGVATERYAEGLVAKLMFKVVAFYAEEENWNPACFGFYLNKITAESSFADIATTLEPLKKDLEKLTEVYIPFKFAKASLSKNATSEQDSFDDAFDNESIPDKLRKLYLYELIYTGMVHFLTGYFARLCFLAQNKKAILYLGQIFRPAIDKAIENRQVFLGSFETERSKKVLYKKYLELKEKYVQAPKTHWIKSGKLAYEALYYTLPMIEKAALPYRLEAPPEGDSSWAHFLRNYLFFEAPSQEEELDEDELAKLPIGTAEYKRQEQPENLKWFAMSMILNGCLVSSHSYDIARDHLLERFKQQILADRELAKGRIVEIKKSGEKKIREMQKKVKKLERMKQEESARVYANDIKKFELSIAHHTKDVMEYAQQEFIRQKGRIKKLFAEIAQEKKRPTGRSAGMITSLAESIEQGFLANFAVGVLAELDEGYEHDLDLFYENLEQILHPDLNLKLKLIKSLERHGASSSKSLQLSDEEQEALESVKDMAIEEIAKIKPDIWDYKLVLMANLIPVKDVFALNLEQESLFNLLQLKVTSPQNPKAASLPAPLIKAFLAANKTVNPMPMNNVLQPGFKQQADPVKKINQVKVSQLLRDKDKKEEKGEE